MMETSTRIIYYHMHVVQCDKNVISTFQEEEIGVKIGNGFILADEEVVFR